jgi:hypothetical protein
MSYSIPIITNHLAKLERLDEMEGGGENKLE